MFEAVIDFLKPYNEIVGVAGIVATVFVGVYYFHRAKREKLPIYVWDSIPWIEGLVGKLPGLKVMFNDVTVERVTITKLYFWNAGRETIRQADLTPAAPLAIKFAGGVNVLDARVARETHPACSAKVAPPVATPDGPTTLGLSFDYLDYNDGFVVQLVHDGAGAPGISVVGKIIGAPEVKFSMSMSRGSEPGDKANQGLHRNIASARFYFLLSFLVLGFVSYMGTLTLLSEPGSIVGWFLSVAFGIISALSLLMVLWQPEVPRRLYD